MRRQTVRWGASLSRAVAMRARRDSAAPLRALVRPLAEAAARAVEGEGAEGAEIDGEIVEDGLDSEGFGESAQDEVHWVRLNGSGGVFIGVPVLVI